MATVIMFPDSYQITIDSTRKRNHKRSASMTKHKVEKGADISDHTISENKKLSLECIINEYTKKGESFLHEIAQDRLEQAMEKTELVTVITKRKIYENMFITSLDFSESASQGFSFYFNLDLEEFRFTESQNVKLDKNSFQNKTDQGKSNKNKPTKQQQMQIDKLTTKPKGGILGSIGGQFFKK